jgi:copper transport protein
MHARQAAMALLLTLPALALAAGVALGHSELESSTPADGAVLAVAPAEIGGDFTEAVDPARSTMELRGPDGAVLAKGGVPDGGPATRMTIAGLPALAPGEYEVRWSTVTPDDSGVERGTFALSVAAATPLPSDAPAPGQPLGAGLGDVLLPLAVLAAVLVGGGAWLARRRR